MSDSPLAAVRTAERDASERIAAAEIEAGEIVEEARAAARRFLDDARAALGPEREKLQAASLAEAEAAAARVESTEPRSTDGLAAQMLAAVLPEEA